MSNQRTCCGNCVNKTEKNHNANNAMLYCDIKRRRVDFNGLCQWHDLEKQEVNQCNS